jgi:hypothetical protein
MISAMEFLTNKGVAWGVLAILYITFVQLFIDEGIRTELRLELGLLNLFVFPICLAINIYIFIVIALKTQRKRKVPSGSDWFYVIFSILAYALIFLNIFISFRL